MEARTNFTQEIRAFGYFFLVGVSFVGWSRLVLRFLRLPGLSPH